MPIFRITNSVRFLVTPSLAKAGSRSILVTHDSYGVNRQLRARRSSGHKKELQEEIFTGACSFEKDIYPTTTIRKNVVVGYLSPLRYTLMRANLYNFRNDVLELSHCTLSLVMPSLAKAGAKVYPRCSG